MKGISWTDLDAEEQRAIAVLGAGLCIELFDPVALQKLKRLGPAVGPHLTVAAHECPSCQPVDYNQDLQFRGWSAT
ncbi:hypothetical protein ACVWZK_001569 [Bradyrhizobium sp. GM0.4]